MCLDFGADNQEGTQLSRLVRERLEVGLGRLEDSVKQDDPSRRGCRGRERASRSERAKSLVLMSCGQVSHPGEHLNQRRERILVGTDLQLGDDRRPIVTARKGGVDEDAATP